MSDEFKEPKQDDMSDEEIKKYNDLMEWWEATYPVKSLFITEDESINPNEIGGEWDNITWALRKMANAKDDSDRLGGYITWMRTE